MTTFADNPAEVLREAMSLLRSRADHPDVSQARWEASPHGDVHDDGCLWVCDTQSAEAADHIAALDPAVALALANLLDQAAGIATWRKHVGDGPTADLVDHCLDLARTYLRSDR